MASVSVVNRDNAVNINPINDAKKENEIAPMDPTHLTRCLLSTAVSFVLLFYFCSTMIPDEETSPSLTGYSLPFTLSMALFFSLRIFFNSCAPHLILKHFNRGGVVKDWGTAEKIAHHTYSVTAHTLAGIYLYVYLSHRDWFWRDSGVWEGFPSQHHLKFDMIMYVCQIGYHLNSLLMVTREPPREDYAVIMVHHGVTAFLLLCSFHMNFIRIGLIVLLYHDASDGFVGLSKLCNYYNYKAPTVVSVAAMILMWLYCRIWCFGRLIVFSAYPVFDKFEFASACVISLATLWVMHVWWWSLMLKIVTRMLKSKGKELSDPTEKKAMSASNSSTTLAESQV
eukprot:PhM_4_TR11591/c0_g1_i1/m.25139/K04710/CERS; ceramide synthetase